MNRRLRTAAARLLAPAIVLAVFGLVLPRMAALPGLGLARALVLTQAATAVASVFPGGEAVGIGLQLTMLRAWRFRRGAGTAATAVLTAFNLVVKGLIPLGAVTALLVSGHGSG